MMLHDRTVKTDIIENIKGRVEKYIRFFSVDTLLLNQKVHTYIGCKIQNEHIFLINESGRITYPRGVHGKVLKEVYEKLKNREFYVKKTFEGVQYKVKPKKKN